MAGRRTRVTKYWDAYHAASRKVDNADYHAYVRFAAWRAVIVDPNRPFYLDPAKGHYYCLLCGKVHTTKTGIGQKHIEHHAQ